jgi:uncharacterized protein YdeI (YjbR/CyaY-like superfamily)
MDPPTAVFFADAEALDEALCVGWAFFAAQPPSYRRTAAFWIMSAKQEATRQRRLAEVTGRARSD